MSMTVPIQETDFPYCVIGNRKCQSRHMYDDMSMNADVVCRCQHRCLRRCIGPHLLLFVTTMTSARTVSGSDYTAWKRWRVVALEFVAGGESRRCRRGVHDDVKSWRQQAFTKLLPRMCLISVINTAGIVKNLHGPTLHTWIQKEQECIH